MRILVTGGAGFIGRHVTLRLLAQGHAVTVLDNLSSARPEPMPAAEAFALRVGDVRDAAAVRSAMEGVTAVVHLAAVVSVQQTTEDPVGAADVNVGGTVAVLDAARAAGVATVVFASSAAVYGNALRQPVREEDAPAPRSPYAIQKLTGEEYCAQAARGHGPRTLCLRFFNVYGPGQQAASGYAAVIPAFCAALRAGQSLCIHGDGSQTRDFVHVADVAEAVAAGLRVDCGRAQIVNIGSGRETPVFEVADELEGVAGRRGAERRHAPVRPGDVRESIAHIGRAREWLQWSPRVILAAGLREAWDWFGREAAR